MSNQIECACIMHLHFVMLNEKFEIKGIVLFVILNNFCICSVEGHVSARSANVLLIFLALFLFQQHCELGCSA